MKYIVFNLDTQSNNFDNFLKHYLKMHEYPLVEMVVIENESTTRYEMRHKGVLITEIDVLSYTAYKIEVTINPLPADIEIKFATKLYSHIQESYKLPRKLTPTFENVVEQLTASKYLSSLFTQQVTEAGLIDRKQDSNDRLRELIPTVIKNNPPPKTVSGAQWIDWYYRIKLSNDESITLKELAKISGYSLSYIRKNIKPKYEALFGKKPIW